MTIVYYITDVAIETKGGHGPVCGVLCLVSEDKQLFVSMSPYYMMKRTSSSSDGPMEHNIDIEMAQNKYLIRFELAKTEAIVIAHMPKEQKTKMMMRLKEGCCSDNFIFSKGKEEGFLETISNFMQVTKSSDDPNVYFISTIPEISKPSDHIPRHSSPSLEPSDPSRNYGIRVFEMFANVKTAFIDAASIISQGAEDT